MTTALQQPDSSNHADVDSFYHLQGVDLRSCACQGLACYVARHLNPQRWQQACTQPQRVHCLGKCCLAPAHGADQARPHCHIDSPHAIILPRIAQGGARSIDAYRCSAGYHALESALRQSPSTILQSVEASELRGRGGAGFPTGRKWRMAAQQSAACKYIVANADEGDPGAYIDRFILEDDPHCLIEAMTIAAFATGATQGFIYLRYEYPDAALILTAAINEARDAGWLGQRIRNTGFHFDIQLHIGRGSYVCGEETALFNSIEGKRPCATSRPPFATEKGLFNQPTVINNVETLANIPWIIRHGPDAYRKLGFSKSRGNKVLSLNSLFRRPGLYEVQFGIPVRRIVEELGGGLHAGEIKGLIIGGPLAGVIPPSHFDTPLGFEELAAIGATVGHGGVVAFDQHTTIPQLIQHVFEFAAFESCGKCIPCRLGTRSIQHLFENIAAGTPATANQRRQLIDILIALKQTSLCGLGSGAADFADSLLRHYHTELEPCFK